MWKSWLKQLSRCLAGRPVQRTVRRERLSLEALEDRSLLNATFDFAYGFGATGADEGTAVATDAAGNLYVTGSFTDTLNLGGPILNSAGGTDVFVAKYDSAGTLQWAKSFGGVFEDAGEDIAVDSGGNVYVTGRFSGTSAAFGSGNLSSLGGTDIFVTKLSSAGAGVWDLAMGGSDDDGGNALAVAGSGDVVVTGYFRGTATMGSGVLTGGLGTDVFVTKLTSGGAGLWDARLGGNSEEVGLGIGVDSAGNVYTTGYFQGTADFNPDPLVTAVFNLISAGGDDVFISKLDSGGNFLFAQAYGSTSDDRGNDLTVQGSNILITGSFQDTVTFGATTLTSLGSSDIFVDKVSTSGVQQWAVGMGGAGEDSGQSVAVDGAGNVYVTGYFQGSAAFGTAGLTSNAGTRDVFVSRISPTGIPRWAMAAGGEGVDEGHGIAVTSSGTTIYNTGSYADASATFGSTNLTNAGSSDIFLVKLTQDVIPPVTTATLSGSVGANGWYTSPVQVTLNATDNSSGVSQTQYRVNGGAWQVYTSPFTVSGDGAHLVEYYSLDNAGNQEATQSVSFQIETTGPTTTASLAGSQGTNGWYFTSVQVSLSATDATSGVAQTQYRINGGAWQVYSGAFTVSDNGTYTVEYYSIDNAGNVEAVKSVSFVVETRFVTQGTTLVVNGTNGNDVFTFNVDASSILVSVNGVYQLVSRSQIQNVVFEGKNGLDTGYYAGWAANETLWIAPGAAVMTDGFYGLFVNSVELQTVATGFGIDTVYLYDSAANDFYINAPGFGWMSDGFSYGNVLYGYTFQFTFGGTGGFDQAYLYDSVGNDFLVTYPGGAQISDGVSYYNALTGFGFTQAILTSGGFDQGFFFDSTGVDLFAADQGVYVMAGSSYQNWAAFLDVVYLYVWNGFSWSYLDDIDSSVTTAFNV